MRKLLAVLVLLLLIAGGVWFMAGRSEGPTLTFGKPGPLVGQTGELELKVDPHGTPLQSLDVAIEQDGARTPLFSLPGNDATKLTQQPDGSMTLTRPIGKKAVPALKQGKARIVATSSRTVLFGRRVVSSEASRDFEVRLVPPQVAVVSMHHFVNHGGSEMVVYRVTPADVESGVRVGDVTYKGYPASAAGVTGADPSLKIGFFALLYDQDLAAPVTVWARDAAGNEGTAPVETKVFEKVFRKSQIAVDDAFLAKVVPPILANTPSLKVNDPSNLLESYLVINRELRKENAKTLVALADKSAPDRLWQGTFKQLVNSAVESSFADQRTYVYKGQNVDQQVHLGFDLASLAHAPVHASNAGRVVFADFLGIYGNCVVVDHGLGLQSLYAHLSSIGVKVGDTVTQDQELGRSGSTGLAGGDHLHFTMLLGGHAVTPVDWWSAQWVQDRILRKLREASTGPAAAGTDAAAAPAAPEPARPARRAGRSKR
jgi:murein DD-endopeptidase MepM/ murein hydrolase activator NlpD